MLRDKGCETDRYLRYIPAKIEFTNKVKLDDNKCLMAHMTLDVVWLVKLAFKYCRIFDHPVFVYLWTEKNASTDFLGKSYMNSKSPLDIPKMN